MYSGFFILPSSSVTVAISLNDNALVSINIVAVSQDQLAVR